jgi:hypothetical protein
MNFGQAVESAKLGSAIAREGWNGKGMFVYFVEGTELEADLLRGAAATHVGSRITKDEIVKINGHFDMKAADGSIVVGWLASQTDLQAEDWTIIL